MFTQSPILSKTHHVLSMSANVTIMPDLEFALVSYHVLGPRRFAAIQIILILECLVGTN